MIVYCGVDALLFGGNNKIIIIAVFRNVFNFPGVPAFLQIEY